MVMKNSELRSRCNEIQFLCREMKQSLKTACFPKEWPIPPYLLLTDQ